MCSAAESVLTGVSSILLDVLDLLLVVQLYYCVGIAMIELDVLIRSLDCSSSICFSMAVQVQRFTGGTDCTLAQVTSEVKNEDFKLAASTKSTRWPAVSTRSIRMTLVKPAFLCSDRILRRITLLSFITIRDLTQTPAAPPLFVRTLASLHPRAPTKGLVPLARTNGSISFTASPPLLDSGLGSW